MIRFLTALLFLALSFQPAQAQNFPDYEEIYVNDFANLLSGDQEQAVRGKLQALRRDHGIEFTVVTISQMADYDHYGAIEPFATGLFNYWGVGNAQRNDGVMMLVARYDREMRIEVGSGYGTAKNAPMKRIIDNVIIPEFKADEYAAGIQKGVDAVIADLTGVWPGEDTAWKKTTGTVRRLFERFHAFLVGALGVLGGAAYWLFRRWRRYRPRTCPLDGEKMQMLAEHWDDNHLQPGQIREEELKSVDYDVWECPRCEHRIIEAYKALFSRFGACRSCGYRTVEGDTEILEQATTKSTGRKRIDYTCHNCHESYSVEKTIPMKSSSSSSGGSSFGGGSSSGGGASGSW